MLKNYIKIAWRNIFRHTSISLINIGGLAIGMTAAIFIMIWVNNELSFDSYHPDADHIFRTRTAMQFAGDQTTAWATSPYLLGEGAKSIHGVTNVTRMRAAMFDKLYFTYKGNQLAEKKCAYVDRQWFNVFHYDFIDGSPASFNSNPRSIIMTAGVAKRYFGRHEAVGQVLKLDSVNYEVQAVVKDNPANSTFQYDILIPAEAEMLNPKRRENVLSWSNFYYYTFLKLQPGTDTVQVGHQLKLITQKARKTDETHISLVALKSIHFETGLGIPMAQTGSYKLVDIFVVLGAVILIIACINYINLTTAKASLRTKEVSIRKIIGAGRNSLFTQFMTESLLVSLLALGVAAVLLQVLLPLFNIVTEKNFVSPLSTSSTWYILLGTLLFCFVLNGLYPALLLSSFNPLKVFKSERISFKDNYLRRILVIVQFTASIVLIIASMVIYLQLKYMEQADLGFAREHIFSFTIPWKVINTSQNKTFLATVKNELKRQPAIADVVQTSTEKFYDNGSSHAGGNDWIGRSKDFDPMIFSLEADDHLLKFMQLKLKAGRWFLPGNREQHRFVVNESVIQDLNLHEPVLGQRFVMQGDTGAIIGVVKNFHFQNLHTKIAPMVIDNDLTTAGSFYIKTLPGHARAAIQAAQNVYSKLIPGQPFEYQFVDEGYNQLYHTEQRSSALVMLFAVVAVFISALGLFGLAAFAAEQRVKEVGIRKVLGATVTQLTALLSVNFIKMVLVANLVAFPLAWWLMNKWLQDFAYRIPFSWWIFAGAGLLAALIALLTIGSQTIRAALANPVKSLRSE